MVLSLPFRANCPTRADLFRQIFRDHFDRWCDLRLDDAVPADQRATVRQTIEVMLDQLPGAYAKSLYEEKCEVVYQHIFEAYPGTGSSLYGTAG